MGKAWEYLSCKLDQRGLGWGAVVGYKFVCDSGCPEWASDHTPTRWWPRPICTCTEKWHWATKRSKLSLLFVLCGGLHSYKGIKTACHGSVDEKLPCWIEGFSTADLGFGNFGASLTGSLVFCIHNSRLSLFCSNHLQGRDYFHGRQTEENHLVHTGTISTYHIMTSSIHLGSFFRSLYFRGSKSVHKNCKNFPLHATVWKWG